MEVRFPWLMMLGHACVIYELGSLERPTASDAIVKCNKKLIQPLQGLACRCMSIRGMKRDPLKLFWGALHDAAPQGACARLLRDPFTSLEEPLKVFT